MVFKAIKYLVNVYVILSKVCQVQTIYLDDVHVWRGRGRGGRGGGAEGGDSERRTDLSSREAVEVLVHCPAGDKLAVTPVVTGALVHSSPEDGKEWSVLD